MEFKCLQEDHNAVYEKYDEAADIGCRKDPLMYKEEPVGANSLSSLKLSLPLLRHTADKRCKEFWPCAVSHSHKFSSLFS